MRSVSEIAVAIISHAAAVVCLSSAYMLAMQGRDGWGWFLFVGLIIGLKDSDSGSYIEVGPSKSE